MQNSWDHPGVSFFWTDLAEAPGGRWGGSYGSRIPNDSRLSRLWKLFLEHIFDVVFFFWKDPVNMGQYIARLGNSWQ